MIRCASFTALPIVLTLSTCAPDGPPPVDHPKYFEANGTVVSIEGEYVILDHEDIPGFMDAMTMTFPVTDPALLVGLEPGTRVAFRVAVEGASYEVDRIEPFVK